MPARPDADRDLDSALGGRAATAAPVWRVDLLGGLRLCRGTLQLTRLPSRAVTVLLARLALAPQRAHAREELIELLWPGVALDVGRNRLRQALSTLKSVLEPAAAALTQPVLQADRDHLRVVDGSMSCDAVQFEAAAHAGRAAAARALYRGELLPGLYDEWIHDERLRLAALHAQLPSGDHPASALAAEHHGNLAAMPAGVSPLPMPAARVQLPHYLTRMFGAESPAARLRAQLLAHRLVTLVGPGGAGKTRLAVEVAHSLREHAGWPLPAAEPAQPFDLIAFVPLVACRTPAQAIDALLGSLQIATGAGDPFATLVDALQGRRALLVLDNFEQLVDTAVGLVAQLVAQTAQLHLLVTSRRALELDGEREFALAALELPPPPCSLAAAAHNPAVALFVERARAVRADFHLSERNAATLVALVRELEGMPLAIELAAARVRSIAPAELLERLRGPGTPRLDLLARGATRGTTDPRHASMQRTIAWSWDQLDTELRRLLLSLTTFAEGFSAAAAASLCAGEPFDVALRLDDLVARSLVHARSDGDTLRFALYQPIREFVAARLSPADATHWRSRLRGWALQWARALPPTPPLPALHAEMANLCAALAAAADDGVPGDAIELLALLRRVLEDVELPAAGLQHAQAAVDACTDPILRARGHSLVAPLLFTAGQREAAWRHAEAGVACAGLTSAQRARALHALARVRWRSRRRVAEVEPLLDEAQALLPAQGDDDLRASLLALRAFVANAGRRDLACGEALHAQALAQWQRSGNQHAINSGHYNLAVCAQNAGRNAECLQRLEPVIASARALQDQRRLSQSLNVLGNACSALHDWPRAHAAYRECIDVAWRGMASYDLAYGLWNLPRALLHLRRAETALRLLAFAATFWRSRFGELSAEDHRYLQRARRLGTRLLPGSAIDRAWQEGEQLSLAQAVALALQA